MIFYSVPKSIGSKIILFLESSIFIPASLNVPWAQLWEMPPCTELVRDGFADAGFHPFWPRSSESEEAICLFDEVGSSANISDCLLHKLTVFPALLRGPE
jgi:hypothetical protein